MIRHELVDARDPADRLAGPPDAPAMIAAPVHAAGSDQILFTYSRVGNYRDLLKGLAAGTQVYVLVPGQGGLAQIAAILADRRNVADISIIAHGNSGEIQLGSTVVSEASLPASAAALHTIGAAIAPAATCCSMAATSARAAPAGASSTPWRQRPARRSRPPRTSSATSPQARAGTSTPPATPRRSPPR